MQGHVHVHTDREHNTAEMTHYQDCTENCLEQEMLDVYIKEMTNHDQGMIKHTGCNSYIMGARDLCDILHQSLRALYARGLSAICRHRSRAHMI